MSVNCPEAAHHFKRHTPPRVSSSLPSLYYAYRRLGDVRSSVFDVMTERYSCTGPEVLHAGKGST